MNSVRKNTLVVDLSVLPVRPDAAKVQHFLENEIKLDLSDVKSIQLHNTRNCVFVEMVDHAIAQRYAKAHNVKRIIVCKDKPFKIPVYVDSEAVTVRVHDLPPSISLVTIGNYMTRFGDVISVQNERWKNYFPGIYNGVRVLQMRLKQSIPSFVTIEGETAMVLHPNQTRTCRYCLKAVHPKQKCLEVTASAIATPTAASTAPPASEPKFTETDFPPMSQPTSSSPSTFNEIVRRGISTLAEHETRSMTVVNLTAEQATQQKTNDTNDDDEDYDDDDGNSSSSAFESNDDTNKRRLSTKRSSDKKKICADQALQNAVVAN